MRPWRFVSRIREARYFEFGLKWPIHVAIVIASRLTIRRDRTLGWLLLPIALVGCGGDKSKATLSVTCGGSVALAGAGSIDVLGDPVNGRPTLTFPDPANPGTTGTMALPPASRCSITPTTGAGG
jgi:hypothetical protein